MLGAHLKLRRLASGNNHTRLTSSYLEGVRYGVSPVQHYEEHDRGEHADENQEDLAEEAPEEGHPCYEDSSAPGHAEGVGQE